MKHSSMESALDLIWDQYQEMTGHHNSWELAYLKDEAKKGTDELGEACRVLFGENLETALHQAIAQACEMNAQACSLSKCWGDEEEMEDAVLLARDLAGAVKLIHTVQRATKCGGLEQSRELVRSTADYAEDIQAKAKLWPFV